MHRCLDGKEYKQKPERPGWMGRKNRSLERNLIVATPSDHFRPTIKIVVGFSWQNSSYLVPLRSSGILFYDGLLSEHLTGTSFESVNVLCASLLVLRISRIFLDVALKNNQYHRVI